MDDRQKESVMEDYTIHQKEQAEEWFDNEFCEYEVEWGIYVPLSFCLDVKRLNIFYKIYWLP